LLPHQLQEAYTKLEHHWVASLFFGHGLVSQQTFKDEAFQVYQDSGMLSAFPNSSYLQGQIALAHYHQRGTGTFLGSCSAMLTRVNDLFVQTMSKHRKS